MDLTPGSEISSTAEVNEMVIPAHENEEAKAILTKQQLEKENKELRLMCGQLGEAYHKSRELELEWQSFGRYTAEVLREELATSESRSRVTREELERLMRENKELREMCLFLDQSRDGGSETSSLTPPEAMEILLHGRMAGEVNRVQGRIPRYTGKTEHATLRDSEAIRVGMMSERNKEMALTEMKKRLERLEAERLELMKSLSVAHTLAADTNSARRNEGAAGGGRDQLPVHLKQQLDDIMGAGKTTRKQQLQGKGNGDTLSASPDVIQNAVTLLDVVRRLDATAASGFSDGVEEGEAVALRLLVNIAWQKIQENVNKKVGQQRM